MKTVIENISDSGEVLSDEQLLQAVGGGVKEIHGPSQPMPGDATSTGTHDYYRGVSRWDGDAEVGPTIGR